MKNNLNYVFSGIAVVGTLIQTEHIFQILCLILTCISVLLSLILSIQKWFKQAKADGKIDSEEINEAITEINKAVDEIKNSIDKGDTHNENGD